MLPDKSVENCDITVASEMMMMVVMMMMMMMMMMIRHSAHLLIFLRISVPHPSQSPFRLHSY